MQYMLILATDPAEFANLRPDPTDGVYDDWMLYTKALAEAGVLLGGSGLQGIEHATTVQVRGGQRIVTDGPYTEAKEHLLGYYVIDVPDLDTALDWAAKVPSVRIGKVEVRPLMDGTDTKTTVGV